MPSYAVGLMSGTSADGLDAVLVEFPGCRLIRHHASAYPPSLRQALLRLMEADCIDVADYLRADRAWADWAAQVVLALLGRARVPAEAVCVVGSHGQTLRHQPFGPYPNTWQLGDPSRLSALLGRPVVADFRRADMAVGGQGAPFVPAFQAHLGKAPSLWLNLGGIANVTYVSRATVQGFDVVSCNGLLDAWIQDQQGKVYDDQGAWGQSGRVLPGLLARLSDHPYLKAKPPKSLCRQDMSLGWLRQLLAGDERPEDVQATLMAWVVAQVVSAVEGYEADTVYVFGGGVHNTALMASLREALLPRCLQSTETLGWPVSALEAGAFAWLAWQRLTGTPVALMDVTGALRPVCLGGIYQV